ncbi:MAG: transaldolase family protein [Chloroflexota bacterium]
MTCTTPTVLWNDSCAQSELQYAIEHGAVGATANPVIAGAVLKQEFPLWKDRIVALIRERPTATEDELAWRLVEELSIKGAALLYPAFEKHAGRNGRLSIQTDPRFYRDTQRIVEQAVHFSQLAPNMIVKIPVTAAGVPAIEEATYRGVSINATVSFTVPQTLAVAEAVERGLKRREAEGKDISHMGPVCTIMVGRLDDWLKVVANKQGIMVDPGCLEWAGVAAMKKAYRIYRERGYRLRLLSAAFRNHMHWSEFIGGDMVVSPTHQWQVNFNASGIKVKPRMDKPVPSRILEMLYVKFEEFHRAYDEDGLSVAEFDDYGATLRTMRQFLEGTQFLASFVRDFMVRNPDK